MRARLFIPFTKVDLEKGEVYGCAAEERTDKTGREKFDYASSKPFFEAWSADFLKRTTDAGLEPSLGNVRLMHQPIVAGKLADIGYDDAGRAISVCAKVGNADVLGMVERGELTGFSIGGEYVKRWPDPDEKGVTRYTANPVEVSLVDNPCMYGATIQMVKAAGITADVALTGGAMSESLAAQKARIAALQKRLEAKPGDMDLVKSLYTVGRLAEILQSLSYLIDGLKYERDAEKDDSTAPEDLAAATAQVADAFLAIAEESVRELREGTEVDAGLTPLVMARASDLAKLADLEKAGARNSRADATRIQKIHDLAADLAAVCAQTTTEKAALAPTEEDPMDQATLEKALVAHGEGLTKALGEQLGKAITAATDPLAKALGEATSKIDALAKTVDAQAARLQALEDQPAAPKGVAKVVPSKEDDDHGVQKAAAPDPEKADAVALMKFAQRPEAAMTITRPSRAA